MGIAVNRDFPRVGLSIFDETSLNMYQIRGRRKIIYPTNRSITHIHLVCFDSNLCMNE
jgi:hypothetical protein